MIRILLATTAVIALSSPAHAVLQIAADVGGTLFFCADQQACDQSAVVGVLSIEDQLINGVQFTGSTQLQAVGATNFLNTSSTQIINNSGTDQVITVAVGGIDFAGPVETFSASGSGTFQSADGSTILMNFYGDTANGQGADSPNDTPGALLSSSGQIVANGSTDAYSFTDSGAFIDPNLFSMTLFSTGTLVDGGQFLGRSQAIIAEQVAVVPEPGTLGLLGAALFGLLLRRRRLDHSAG
jgi:hypothetical protein